MRRCRKLKSLSFSTTLLTLQNDSAMFINGLMLKAQFLHSPGPFPFNEVQKHWKLLADLRPLDLTVSIGFDQEW